MIRISDKVTRAACCLGVAVLAAVVEDRDAIAYEVTTHRILSLRAMDQSAAFGEPASGILFDLDVQPGARFADSEGVLRTVNELIGGGAVLEDERARFLFHFLGPQHDGRGLSAGIVNASSSIEWILQDTGVVNGVAIEQNFSYPDARRYFLNLLSLRTRAERDRNAGLMYETLGHIAHHLQDMAQPDHVRNDDHLVGFDTSPHHVWTAERGENLALAGYPKPSISQLSRLDQLWTDGRRGIADFTSFNFVSEDTNFVGRPPHLTAAAGLPSPVPSNVNTERTTLAELLGHQPPDLPDAEIWFIGNQVADALNPLLSGFNPRASTYSIFANDLAGLLPGPGPGTSLNRFNFEANNQWLLPRAAAYSAAAYDYFFRARLAIESTEIEQGTVTLTVRNASANGVNLRGQAAGQGDGFEWAVHYDTNEGVRSRLPLTNDDLGTTVLESGATVEVSFPLPQNVDSTLNKPFTLVFHGTAGTEPAIAGKMFSAVPATGFLVRPSYLPADGYAGRRQLARAGGVWLAKRSDASAGNVDWKGHNPADTLTWFGPPSRYFYANGPRGFSSLIYKGGRLLTQAPALVQGVAISRAGEPRLCVVTYESGSLRVYTRPLRDEYANNSPYDPVANPDGWRLIYSATELPPFTPTFFNASGNEAQLITVSGNFIANRVRLSISADVVTRTSVSAAGSGIQRSYNNEILPQGTHELSIGTRDDQGGYCTWGDECTRQEDCGFGLMCTRHEKDVVDSDSTIYETGADMNFSNRTALCVDYVGDAEVLCQVAYRHDATSFSRAATTATLRTTSRLERTCPDTITNTFGSVGHAQYDEEYSQGNGVRTLRIGAIEIPLMGNQRDGSRDWTVDITRNGLTVSFTGHTTLQDTVWNVSSKLLYVDARNSTIVYETSESHRVNQAQGSNPTPVGGGSNNYRWGSAQSVIRESSNRETIAYVRGQRISMARDATEPTETQFDPSHIPPPGFPSVSECSDTARENREEHESAFTDSLNWSGIIHPRANDASQGYAVDSDGNYVISQPLWNPSGSTFIRAGTWNGISNGDFGLLVPGANQGAFIEIKLLQ